MLKRKLIFILTICLFITSVTYVGLTIAADKGRQYYEETGQVLWDIKTEEKIIALTFDDGPHPKYTTQILDLLKKYEAKATFFVIGKNAEKHPEVVLRQYTDGHDIANHTYTHTFYLKSPELKEELRQTNDIIFSITGFYPELFRPVGGQYTDDNVSEARKAGYTVIMWSWHQDTEDWKSPGVKKIVRKVLNSTKPGDVILFHDGGGNRAQTVKALEEILPELKKQGYKFVTITELIEYRNKALKN